MPCGPVTLSAEVAHPAVSGRSEHRDGAAWPREPAERHARRSALRPLARARLMTGSHTEEAAGELLRVRHQLVEREAEMLVRRWLVDERRGEHRAPHELLDERP